MDPRLLPFSESQFPRLKKKKWFQMFSKTLHSSEHLWFFSLSLMSHALSGLKFSGYVVLSTRTTDQVSGLVYLLLALHSFWFQHRHRLLGEFLLTSLNRISCPLSMLPVPQLTFLSVLNTQRILLCPLDPSSLYTAPSWQQRCIYCSPLSAEGRSRPRFPWGCPQLSLHLESFQTQILWGGPCLQKLTTTS